MSDLSVWAACLATCVLGYLIARQRPLPLMLVAVSALFVVACGAVQLVGAVTFWPAHPLSALSRFLVAIATWATIAALFPATRRVLNSKATNESEREIASRHQAEEALRESEERYRLLVEGVREYAIFTLDADGRITSWNDGAKRIKGYTAKEVAGQHISRFYTEDDVTTGLPDRLLREAAATGTCVDEGWRVRKDGSRFWASIVLTALRDGTGTLKGFSKITRDMTCRKRSEDLLREARENLEERVAELAQACEVLRKERTRFRTLAETSPGAIVSLRQHPDGTITFPYASPVMGDLFGCTPEHLASDGSPALAVLHPDDRERLARTMAECASAGCHWCEEFRVIHPTKGEIWIEANARPQREPDCSVLWHGFLTDISARKVEGEVRALNAELQQRVDERTAALAVSEAASRRQSSLLAMILDSTTEGIVAADTDGRFLLFNHSAEKMLGCGAMDIPLEHWADSYRLFESDGVTLVSADRLPLVRAIRGRATRGQRLTVIRDESPPLVIECFADPLTSSIGEHLGGVVVFRDVTELRKKELVTRENDRRLSLALEAARMGVWEWDITTNAIFWSLRCYAITGIKKQVVGLEDFRSLVHPEDAEWLWAGIERTLSERQPFEAEYRILCPDGQVKWISNLARAEYDESGTPLRLVGTIQDVSEKKAAEEQLRQSEARFRTFVDHTTDSFFLQDAVGVVLDVNRQACASLGYTREELIGKSPMDFDPLCTPDFAEQIFHRLDVAGWVAFDSVHKRKDGTTFPVEVRIRRFVVGDRRFAIASVGDITVRKVAEEQLRGALAEKEVLLREIHHRVKNNLQVVHSLLDMQIRQGPSDPVWAIREAQDRIHSMAMIHEQLYQHDTLSSIDFAEYLRSLVCYLLGTYRSDESGVTADLDLTPLELPVDSAIPCGLIVNELICNCLKHAFTNRKYGFIRMILSTENRIVMISVQDDGVGMSAGVDVRNPKTLGLRLITALADQISGSVDFQSHNGTTVRLVFPLPSPRGQAK